MCIENDNGALAALWFTLAFFQNFLPTELAACWCKEAVGTVDYSFDVQIPLLGDGVCSGDGWDGHSQSHNTYSTKRI